MHHVQIGKHSVQIPSSWNELSKDEFIYACRMFSSQTTLLEFRVAMLHKFLSINRRLWHFLAASDVYNLSQAADFLLDEVTLTRSLIKTIRLRKFPFTRLHGPSDSLSYCTFGEFTKAQVRYEKYSETKNESALNELVAILYRPKKPFWFIRRHFCENEDCRVKYWDRTLHGRSKGIALLPLELKYGVFLFFSGVMASLPARFPNLYRPKDSESSHTDKNWSTLIISLSEGKTDDASLDRILNSNLYNVMLGLEQKSIEYFEFITSVY